VDFPSPRGAIREVAEADGCPAEPVTTNVASATTETWSLCARDTAVEFVAVAGATHAWMGAEPARANGPEPFAGYDSSTAVWAFLAAHPRA
jgi:poly(3-hydroxybutyrate) depolymerase